MARYDVAVVGGGLVGTATAYELGARGVRTLLVDRADAGRATDAGAGILSPETAQRDEPGWTELVRAAGRHYEALVPKLAGDNGWARCGILQLATRASDVPPWERVAEHATGATEIAPDEARAMVPALGDLVRALHHPAAARVDGRLMSAALRRAAVAEYGVAVCDESVDDIRSLPADAVVIAGGAWSGRFSEQLGVTLPVAPLRGQIIHLGVADHDTSAWPIVQAVYGYYMVPWADARVAVGATVEDAGFVAEATAGGVHDVLRETLRVLPGLANATMREVRVGLRPVSADDLPILGALPGVPHVFVATGHGAEGLLLGPISGALVADVVCGREPALDIERFSAARFSARA
jgi:glycine/D-amino acid oxidase-like deaminating enzyme